MHLNAWRMGEERSIDFIATDGVVPAQPGSSIGDTSLYHYNAVGQPPVGGGPTPPVAYPRAD